MFCRNCGSDIDDQAVVCPHCGVPTNDQPAQPVKTTNTLAILGLVFAFIIPLVGLILSIMGLKKAPACGGSGKGLAIAGIVVSIPSWVLNIIIYQAVLAPMIASML